MTVEKRQLCAPWVGSSVGSRHSRFQRNACGRSPYRPVPAPCASTTSVRARSQIATASTARRALPPYRVAADQQLVHWASPTRAASLQSSYPQAMPNTRWRTRSSLHFRLLAPIGQTTRQRIRQTQALIACFEQYRPAVGAAVRLVEACHDPLTERSLKTTDCRVVSFRMRRPLACGKVRVATTFYHNGGLPFSPAC